MEYQDIQIWEVLAGLGLFLFGMFMMEESLKNLAGRTFKKFLRKHTNNSVKAVFSGTLITGALQSSSMVALLVMSFAGAGIIGLKNGIGIILGANLGTTMTGWIVSWLGFKLDLGAVILPFIAIGGLGIIFLKSEKLSNLSKLLMGFSFIFLGLNYMKNGFAEFAEHIDFSFITDKHPLLFVAFGVLLSASIQSSSASMMIFLSSLAAGVITLNQGFYLVIGGDLGTTITAIIGTINANSIKKKVGWSQVLFNVFNVMLALSFVKGYAYLIKDILKIQEDLFALVVFHSIMNLVGIILLLPFLNQFAKLLNKVISSKEKKIAKKIELADSKETHAGIAALEQECVDFIQKAIALNQHFLKLVTQTQTVDEVYFNLKQYETEIVRFYVALQQNQLSEEEANRINQLVASFRNATLSSKDLKDIKHNLDDLNKSAEDQFFSLYKEVKKNQKQFYSELIALIEHFSVSSYIDIEQLNQIQTGYYQDEVAEIYELIKESKESETDIPSLLNMVREINNSNESLLRAVNNLIAK